MFLAVLRSFWDVSPQTRKGSHAMALKMPGPNHW